MSEQEVQQPVFNIEKIYVKDLSLEVPHAPQVYLQRDQPEVEMELSHGATQIEDGYFEVTITITTTAKLGDKVMFLAELTQAAIFQVRNIPAADLGPVLSVVAPNILFPYARQTVSDLTQRAGFPPVMLAPINFENLYQQQQADQQQAHAETTH
jgi:preprotein translocase subunit SecB